MNLQTDITEIRGRLPELYSAQEADDRVKNEELAEWFDQAETIMLHDLPGAALLTSSALTGTNQQNLVAADTSKTLPTDLIRPISVFVDLNNTGIKHECALVEYETWIQWRTNPNLRPSLSRPLAAIHAGSVYFAPAARVNVTNGLDVQYVKKPTRRQKRFRGSVTTVTSNSVFTDTKAAAAGYPVNYFNSAEFFFTSGTSKGEVRTVSAFSAVGQYTISVAASLVLAGNSYEVGDPSAVPDRYRPAMLEYVCYLARLKEDDERAAAHLGEYQRQLARLSGRPAAMKEVSA